MRCDANGVDEMHETLTAYGSNCFNGKSVVFAPGNLGTFPSTVSLVLIYPSILHSLSLR